MHGIGSLESTVGFYRGEWVRGKKCGLGEYSFASGDQFLGEWSADAQNGFGIFKSTRGQGIYHGSWVDGKRHGKGELIYSNGDVYEGSFVRNKLNGFGVMKYSTGHTYCGEWRDNHREGEGQFSQGKNLYQGYWRRGMRQGFGKQV